MLCYEKRNKTFYEYEENYCIPLSMLWADSTGPASYHCFPKGGGGLFHYSGSL
jgi:hypothetical protein